LRKPTITSGPTGTTTDRTPTFRFASTEKNSTFECRYDSEQFRPCSGSGKDTPPTRLSLSSHTFYVRAIDKAKNTDPTPAQRTFSVVP
jgi:large repetitive protein